MKSTQITFIFDNTISMLNWKDFVNGFVKHLSSKNMPVTPTEDGFLLIVGDAETGNKIISSRPTTFTNDRSEGKVDYSVVQSIIERRSKKTRELYSNSNKNIDTTEARVFLSNLNKPRISVTNNVKHRGRQEMSEYQKMIVSIHKEREDRAKAKEEATTEAMRAIAKLFNQSPTKEKRSNNPFFKNRYL